jgi:hypothetical protein
VKKMLTLRAIQTLHGNEAATQEILRALKIAQGNMRDACLALGVGKSSMYRLINDLGAQDAVTKLVASLGVRIQGKVLPEPEPEPKKQPKPRMRTKKVA